MTKSPVGFLTALAIVAICMVGHSGYTEPLPVQEYLVDLHFQCRHGKPVSISIDSPDTRPKFPFLLILKAMPMGPSLNFHLDRSSYNLRYSNGEILIQEALPEGVDPIIPIGQVRMGTPCGHIHGNLRTFLARFSIRPNPDLQAYVSTRPSDKMPLNRLIIMKNGVVDLDVTSPDR